MTRIAGNSWSVGLVCNCCLRPSVLPLATACTLAQLLLSTVVNNCILLQDDPGYITFVTKLNQDS